MFLELLSRVSGPEFSSGGRSSIPAEPLTELTEDGVVYGGGLTAQDVNRSFLQPDNSDGLVYSGYTDGRDEEGSYAPNLLDQIDRSLANLSGRMAPHRETPKADVGVMVMGVRDMQAYRNLYEITPRALGAVWKPHLPRAVAMGTIGLARLPNAEAQVGFFSLGMRQSASGNPRVTFSTTGGPGYRDSVIMDRRIFSGGTVGWTRPPVFSREAGQSVPANFPETMPAQTEQAIKNIRAAFAAQNRDGRNRIHAMVLFVTDVDEFNETMRHGALGRMWTRQSGLETPPPPFAVISASALVEKQAKVEIFAVANTPW